MTSLVVVINGPVANAGSMLYLFNINGTNVPNNPAYIKTEIKKGTRLNQIMRHTLGLFHGQTGASYWKRYLSENMCVRDADIQKIDHIMDKVKFSNISSTAS